MTLVGLLIGLVVLALLLWLVKTYLPAPFTTPALVVLIVIGIVWVLVSFFPSVSEMKVK
jgi:hypothetical protein